VNRPLRVISLIGPQIATQAAAAVPGIEVVAVPGDQAIGPEVTGDVLVAMPRSPALIGLPPSIPWVHVFGTGVDGVPDEVFDGRVVTCSRGAGAVPISEFVLAAMLAFEKDLPAIWVHEPPKHWSLARLGGLHGRRLAVLGLGGIGSAVARLGVAFGMEVRGLRRTEAPSGVPGVEVAADPMSLVRGAHHVVVAAPATPKTFRLVNAELLAAMPAGVHLVNIARGALVDQEALRDALDAGHVARASLDTCEPEPLPAGHWLYSHPRVRLSPHVSWSSPAMADRIVELFIDNLRARVTGQPLAGVVDPAERY
jgi:phosphoglycerate dehydrogenase-like enzyme